MYFNITSLNFFSQFNFCTIIAAVDIFKESRKGTFFLNSGIEWSTKYTPSENQQIEGTFNFYLR